MIWSYFEDWWCTEITLSQALETKRFDPRKSRYVCHFVQNDRALYARLGYLMSLKFVSRRANQEACINITRGAMSPEQAFELVRLYKDLPPEEFRGIYLDYLELRGEQLDPATDKRVNCNLFDKTSV
jgi:hypothetical protein